MLPPPPSPARLVATAPLATAPPLAASTLTLTSFPMLSSSPVTAAEAADNRAVLDQAMTAFYAAWTTGKWDPFFAMFADDIVFEFPMGPNMGRHTGAAAKEKMWAWRHTHEANDRISDVGENLRLHDGEWVVSCARSTGELGGKPYHGVTAVFLKAKGGKIVEYREYLGGLE